LPQPPTQGETQAIRTDAQQSQQYWKECNGSAEEHGGPNVGVRVAFADTHATAANNKIVLE